MLTKRKISFCKLIVAGETATDAYQNAYGSKNRAACKVSGCNLLKSKEVKERIKELQEINNRVNEKAIQKSVDEIKSFEFADVAERKDYLTKIFRGEIKIKKPFVISGKIMEYPAEPDHADRLKALAELNKMGGDYAPNKIEITGDTFDISLNLDTHLTPPKE